MLSETEEAGGPKEIKESELDLPEEDDVIDAEADLDEGKLQEREEEGPAAAEGEAEEAEEPVRRRGAEKEEEYVEERVYTVPLGRAWIKPAKKRAPKAIRIIRSFVQRHMKVSELVMEEEEEEGGRIIISNEVNEKVWGRGIEKPPRKLRIRAAKDEEGNVTVFLA